MGVGAEGVGAELRLTDSCGIAMRGALATGLGNARLGTRAVAAGALEGRGLGVVARDEGCFGNGTTLTDVLRGFSSSFSRSIGKLKTKPCSPRDRRIKNQRKEF